MATNNSQNSQYSNESDGFKLAGGSTKRQLTLTGADVTITGSGTNTYTMPSGTDTLVGRASTDTLTSKNLTSSTNSVGFGAMGVVRMNFTETTDLFNATSFTGGAWTDFKSNQNFTVGSSTSLIMVSVAGNALVGTTLAGLAARIIIDSAGTPITYKLSGGIVPSGGYANPLAGGATIPITGLSAGTHTIKVQIITEVNNSVYCRAATKAWEGLQITIIELGK